MYLVDAIDMGSIDMPSVPSAELLRHFGRYRDIAQREPVTISTRGRDSLVLLSAEEYQRLKRRDREALGIDEMGADVLAELEAAEMAPEHAPLDDLVKDWTP